MFLSNQLHWMFGIHSDNFNQLQLITLEMWYIFHIYKQFQSTKPAVWYMYRHLHQLQFVFIALSKMINVF